MIKNDACLSSADVNKNKNKNEKKDWETHRRRIRKTNLFKIDLIQDNL